MPAVPAVQEEWTARELAERVIGAIWDEPREVWRGNGTNPGDASVLLIYGSSSNGVVLLATRGSEEFPERGATLVYAVAKGAGTGVRLSGPGIDGELETRLPLGREELRDRDNACSSWPLGVDILIADQSGRLLGIPRTTHVEVLD